MKNHRATFALLVLLCSCASETSVDQAELVDLNPAMNNPDKFAWELFAELNKPFDAQYPDSSVVWESWALARAVFENPNQTPVWEKCVRPDDTVKTFDAMPLQQQRILKFFEQDIEVMFDDQEFSKRIGGLSETRFNRPVFDFIVANDLYYQEAIEQYLQDKEILDLPIDAREIKAVWDTISAANKDKYHYVAQRNEKGELTYWGLTGLHIITKDVPQWTWATFEHVDNPRIKEVENVPLLKSIDRYGRKNGNITPELEALFRQNNLPAKWENYILRGTQTNFTTFTGVPTILANTRTENGFLYTSSCITCHARATIGSTMTFAELPREVQDSIRFAKDPKEKSLAAHYFNSLGFVETVLDEPDAITGEKLLMFIGNPEPGWFKTEYRSGRKDTYKQLDFMWSFSRAKRRNPYKDDSPIVMSRK